MQPDRRQSRILHSKKSEKIEREREEEGEGERKRRGKTKRGELDYRECFCVLFFF